MSVIYVKKKLIFPDWEAEEGKEEDICVVGLKKAEGEETTIVCTYWISPQVGMRKNEEFWTAFTSLSFFR